MAYMDYPRKLSGLGPVFTPTGEVDADMAAGKDAQARVEQHDGHHGNGAQTVDIASILVHGVLVT